MTRDSKPAVATLRVAAGDDRTRYDDFAIALHWLTVGLVLLQFVLAELWDFAPKPIKHLMVVGHMSFGILLALVLVIRIVWRLVPGHRVAPATTGIVEFAAKAVQYLLYLLLCVQAVLGFVLRWSGHEAMSFFGFLIPPFFPPFSKPAHHLVGEAHNYVGWAIIILSLGHAAAALIHHFYLRDNVLWRMLPGQHARNKEVQAPSPEQAARS